MTKVNWVEFKGLPERKRDYFTIKDVAGEYFTSNLSDIYYRWLQIPIALKKFPEQS